MAELVAVVEGTFREKGKSQPEMPKLGINARTGDNLFHAMPAYLPSLHAADVKWLSCYPDNHRRHLPRVNGLIIRNRPGQLIHRIA